MAFAFLILVFFIDHYCGGYLISIAYCPFFILAVIGSLPFFCCFFCFVFLFFFLVVFLDKDVIYLTVKSDKDFSLRYIDIGQNLYQWCSFCIHVYQIF